MVTVVITVGSGSLDLYSQKLAERFNISSSHSPCPAVLLSKGIPLTNLSLNSSMGANGKK